MVRSRARVSPCAKGEGRGPPAGSAPAGADRGRDARALPGEGPPGVGTARPGRIPGRIGHASDLCLSLDTEFRGRVAAQRPQRKKILFL